MNLRLPPLLSDLLAAMALVGLSFAGATWLVQLQSADETDGTTRTQLVVKQSSNASRS